MRKATHPRAHGKAAKTLRRSVVRTASGKSWAVLRKEQAQRKAKAK